MAYACSVLIFEAACAADEIKLRLSFAKAHPMTTAESSSAAHANQFALLGQRRFAPFFWTQFCGAANDNLLKFAFTVLVTYQLQLDWMPPAMAGLVIGALFILPFLLFSATSGQLTDKFDKTKMIRFVKNLEIVIMLIAVWGFVRADAVTLLACVFLMGLHSTLFGPVKFAYLPQALDPREITGGNGMVEMGTFVAILLGQLAGGLLVVLPGIGHTTVALSCLGIALIGRATAQGVPPAPATDPGLRINWNPASETWRNLRLAHGNTVVFRSLLGISWMWFFGATFLSQFPSFAKEVLHGDEQVASLLLAVFSVGIGVGSLLCETLSRRQVEIGLVPLGAIGMSVFAIDLYFASRALPPSAELGLAAFIAQPAHWRVMADLGLMSLFAGIYSVPMYALIQMRSQPTHRARIVAANNILNALFMIASAVAAGALLKAGLTLPWIFLATGVANVVVAFYIFMLVPEYLLRFIAWVLTRCIYRFDVKGGEHIPAHGPAVLVCNHVSFVDAVLLMAASPRPIRFIMDHRIFAVPVLGAIFRLAKAIPIASHKEDPAAYEAAFAQAAAVLREGDLLAIFPEGGITRDGELQPFRGGVMKILDTARAEGLDPPVIPMALTNLWGSFFSRIEVRGGENVAMARPFRRGFFNRVGLNVGAAMPPVDVGPDALRQRVGELIKA
jgi:1-acyl-sn-glycerol-3-phosphate acyltransferase